MPDQYRPYLTIGLAQQLPIAACFQNEQVIFVGDGNPVRSGTEARRLGRWLSPIKAPA